MVRRPGGRTPSPRDRRRASCGPSGAPVMPAAALRPIRWLDRRDATCQEGVSRGPQREARRPRKGRGPRSPARRRVISNLIHFLSANTSAPADAVRPLLPGDARPWPSAESTVHLPSSRPKARPTDRSSPRLGARDTELVQPARGAVAAAGRAASPEGKESLRYDHRLPVARPADRHRVPRRVTRLPLPSCSTSTRNGAAPAGRCDRPSRN